MSGTFTLGSIGFSANSATEANDGSLTMTGTTVFNGVNIAVTWNLTEPAGILNGTISQVSSGAGFAGQMTMTGPLFPTAH